MINWNDFHFERPLWLWALLALPLLIVLLYRRQNGKAAWADVCDPELLPYVVEGQSNATSNHGWLWLLLLGAPAILAMAGPAWERIPQPVFDDKAALVILLDASRSMDAADVKPSRLERAKLKISDILAQRGSGQTALIAYAAEPYVVSPLTVDAKTIQSLVPALSTDIMPAQGSRVDRAIAKALELLNNAGARGHLLLISDGVDESLISQCRTLLQGSGVGLSAIGVGSSSGAPIPGDSGFLKDQSGNIVLVKLESDQLQALARANGGLYADMAVDDSDIAPVLELLSQPGQSLEETELTSDQWREEGPWLLLPLLVLGALLFRRGVLAVTLCIGLTLPPQDALAYDWVDFFRNSDQRGAAAFEAEQHAEAAVQFKNPEWRAAAEYRAGNYARAEKLLSDIDTAEAHYNRGNALVKQSKLQEAQNAYKRALEIDPAHEDARYNLQLLEQQQQDQSGSDSSEQDSQSQDKSDSSSSEQDSSEQNGSSQNNTEQNGTEQNQSDQQNSEQQSEPSDTGQDDQQSQSQSPDEEQQEQDKAQQDLAEPGEQSQQESEASQNESQEDETATDENKAAYQSQYQDKSQAEIDQATQQWLNRIPDEPGNLLRNKFLYEHRQKRQQQTEEKPW